MKKFYSLTLVLLSLLLLSCTSDEKLSKVRLVEIKSVPEGALIIINGLNVGKAPLFASFEANEFSSFVKSVSITAIPQKEDLFTQVISFPAYNPNNPEKSTIPESITFNMFKSPNEENTVETK